MFVYAYLTVGITNAFSESWKRKEGLLEWQIWLCYKYCTFIKIIFMYKLLMYYENKAEGVLMILMTMQTYIILDEHLRSNGYR
jgi:hypothetical protein